MHTFTNNLFHLSTKIPNRIMFPRSTGANDTEEKVNEIPLTVSLLRPPHHPAPPNQSGDYSATKLLKVPLHKDLAFDDIVLGGEILQALLLQHVRGLHTASEEAQRSSRRLGSGDEVRLRCRPRGSGPGRRRRRRLMAVHERPARVLQHAQVRLHVQRVHLAVRAAALGAHRVRPQVHELVLLLHQELVGVARRSHARGPLAHHVDGAEREQHSGPRGPVAAGPSLAGWRHWRRIIVIMLVVTGRRPGEARIPAPPPVVPPRPSASAVAPASPQLAFLQQLPLLLLPTAKRPFRHLLLLLVVVVAVSPRLGGLPAAGAAAAAAQEDPFATHNQQLFPSQHSKAGGHRLLLLLLTYSLSLGSPPGVAAAVPRRSRFELVLLLGRRVFPSFSAFACASLESQQLSFVS